MIYLPLILAQIEVQKYLAAEEAKKKKQFDEKFAVASHGERMEMIELAKLEEMRKQTEIIKRQGERLRAMQGAQAQQWAAHADI